MHIFMTGASGWIGSAVVPHLLAAGHQVTGIARSEASARALESAGVTPLAGDLDQPELLAGAAAASDGVIHLGFKHDFSDYVGAGRTERAAVQAFGDALAGSGRPLLMASGLALAAQGRLLTENDPGLDGPDAPRGGSERLALDFADRGVRSVALRFAATVHGAGDHGFIAQLVAVARERGLAGYIGEGENQWPAVHRDDAARMIILALEKAPAGSVVHGVGEQGVPTRTIAEAIGRNLGVPVASIAPEDAAEHFGWIGRFFGLGMPSSSAITRELLGWEPQGPTLLEDLDAGYYTASS